MSKPTLTEFRVTELEGNFKTLDEKVDKIMTNHLPHIQSAIQSLKTQVSTTTVINVGAIIVGLIIAKFFI